MFAQCSSKCREQDRTEMQSDNRPSFQIIFLCLKNNRPDRDCEKKRHHAFLTIYEGSESALMAVQPD